MHHVITLAIIAFIFIFAIVIAQGTSFSVFFSNTLFFFKNLFRNASVSRDRKERSREKEDNSSGRTIGLDVREKKDKSSLWLTGSPVTTGVQVQITVLDHDGNTIGTKKTKIDDSPLLIGRGSDSGGYEAKLCLPDVNDSPATSRTHCTLSRNGDRILLKDCYDHDSAFTDDGEQRHSVSRLQKTNEYIGDGYSIESGDCQEVDIGDYVLLVRNMPRSSVRNVPTFGYAGKPHLPTKDAAASKPQHVPTKEFKFN